MKRTAALVLLIICAGTIPTFSAGVSWGAANDNGVGIGTGAGTALPIGDLVEVGGFKTLSNAQVTADMALGNVAAVLNDFQIFDTSSIGADTGLDGYWFKGSATSANALSLQNKSIYYFVFNATTSGGASQYGIFTGSTSNANGGAVAAAWKFPDDNANPNTTATDIDQVPHDATGILWGTYGPGSANGFTLYELAPVAPVPEPSTWLAGTLLASSLIPTIRRRFKKQA